MTKFVCSPFLRFFLPNACVVRKPVGYSCPSFLPSRFLCGPVRFSSGGSNVWVVSSEQLEDLLPLGVLLCGTPAAQQQTALLLYNVSSWLSSSNLFVSLLFRSQAFSQKLGLLSLNIFPPSFPFYARLLDTPLETLGFLRLVFSAFPPLRWFGPPFILSFSTVF